MLGNPTTTTATPTQSIGPGGLPYPSTDPNQNSNQDPSFSNGPSVYLYGFLATLVLIFLVSIAVAWKGYRTRRLLRARIDEAIARGVFIPGYDPSNPNLPLFPSTTLGSRLRNGRVMNRPILFEEWISEKTDVEEGEGRWDIKPTALDILRPYDPTPLKTTTTTTHHSSNANSLLNQLLDPLRQYWFVQPPEGADADQLQGRPGRRGRRGRGRTDTSNRLEEEQMEREKEKQKKMEESMGLSGVTEVVASVFIAMPDRGRPNWGVKSAGIVNAGRNAGGGGGGGSGGAVGGGAVIASGSRPSSWQQQLQLQQGVASGSRPTSFSTAAHGASISIGTTAILEERKEELPELVLGVVLVGLREEMKAETVVEEGEGEGDAGAMGSEKGKEPAFTTPL